MGLESSGQGDGRLAPVRGRVVQAQAGLCRRFDGVSGLAAIDMTIYEWDGVFRSVPGQVRGSLGMGMRGVCIGGCCIFI